MESNPLPAATQAYRLQLEWSIVRRFIIAGDKWWETPGLFVGGSGVTIVCPEFNLIFLANLSHDERIEDFGKTFASLPRWETTRYAVTYGVNNVDDNGRVLSYDASLYDCQTGKALIDLQTNKAVAGRKHEVAQLKRGIELLMRGEAFALS